MKFKVGYVDEDAGWQNTFRQYLKEDFEIVQFPIKEHVTIEELLGKIEKSKLDLIVIDYELVTTGYVDFNGDDLAEMILAKYKHFPVLILTSHEDEALDGISYPNIVNGKDMLEDEAPKVQVIIKKINSLIELYNQKIYDSKSIIKELADKRNEQSLTPEEDEMLVKQYIFLDEINPEESFIPEHMIYPQGLTSLDELVQNTRDILEELKSSK